MKSTKQLKVAVLGASGYIGLELLQRLAVHPNIELAFISSETNAGISPYLLFPPLRKHNIFKHLTFQRLSELFDVDLAISALPTGVLPKTIDNIIPKTSCLINVSGDFRLTNEFEIMKYYPSSTIIVNNFSKKYIIPEFDDCSEIKVLSTPGCMAAAVIYAIYPLAKTNLLSEEIIVDAKTGSSGGGSKNSDSHTVRANNVKTHKIIGHRHGAEIEQYIQNVAAHRTKIHMTTTSLDIPRGILVHVHGNLRKKCTELELRRLYNSTYQQHEYVHIVAYKTGTERYPSVKSVVGTNYCEVGFAIDETGQHFVATSSLDNLIKGGAGNAIQAMNKRYNLKTNYSLDSFRMWP